MPRETKKARREKEKEILIQGIQLIFPRGVGVGGRK